METTVKLYTFNYNEIRTWQIAALFILGNMALPQLCHFIPQGGLMFLPIYFFTLISAYKYGWKAGVLTAVFSPLINSFIFGMPGIAVLPAILLKSLLMVGFAALTATHFKRITFLLLTMVVLSYQFVGTIGEWILTGSLYVAIQDFRIGIPGILLQIVGGYLFIKYVNIPTLNNNN